MNRWTVLLDSEEVVEFDSVACIVAPFNNMLGPVIDKEGVWHAFGMEHVLRVMVRPVTDAQP